MPHLIQATSSDTESSVPELCSAASDTDLSGDNQSRYRHSPAVSRFCDASRWDNQIRWFHEQQRQRGRCQDSEDMDRFADLFRMFVTLPAVSGARRTSNKSRLILKALEQGSIRILADQNLSWNDAVRLLWLRHCWTSDMFDNRLRLGMKDSREHIFKAAMEVWSQLCFTKSRQEFDKFQSKHQSESANLFRTEAAAQAAMASLLEEEETRRQKLQKQRDRKAQAETEA